MSETHGAVPKVDLYVDVKSYLHWEWQEMEFVRHGWIKLNDKVEQLFLTQILD